MALNNSDRELLKAAAEIIKNVTAAGEKIQLRGFGTFAVKNKAARTARNPKTGETIQVPAKSVLTFKASKSSVE